MREQIETERLVLRQPELRDGPAMAAHFQDFDVLKMTGSLPYPYLPQAADFWILRTRARQRRGLAHSYMMETMNGDVIGNVSLFRADLNDDFEIGYHLGRNWWGVGYASEACRAVINEAKTHGQSRLVAGVYDDNPASQTIMSKFGFRATEPDNIWCMARSERVKGHRYALDLA